MKCARLAELCTVQRSNLTSRRPEQDQSNSCPFPVIGSGQQPRGYSATCNAEKNSIIISRKGSFGRVSRFDTKTLVTDDAYFITDISPVLDPDYLFHFLHTLVTHKLTKKRDKSILTNERLHNVVVVYPDIDKQKAIAAFYESPERSTRAFQTGFEKLFEPPELLKIRRILENSNRDIFALLQSPARVRFSFTSLFCVLVLFFVLICCLNISQQNTFAAIEVYHNMKLRLSEAKGAYTEALRRSIR